MYECSGLLCDRAAAVWMRGKAWCVPCSIKRFGFSFNAPAQDAAGSAVASRTRPLVGRASVPASVDAAEPVLPLSPDDLEWILENDGWHDVELELFARTGQTLLDVELELLTNLEDLA